MTKYQMMKEGYVYTLSGVRSGLARGHKRMLLFVPNSGRIVSVTKANFKKVSKLFNTYNC